MNQVSLPEACPRDREVHDAEVPMFDAFLQQMQSDPVLRDSLLCWFALSMTAMSERRFAFHYGPGASGKCVLIDPLAEDRLGLVTQAHRRWPELEGGS